MAQRVTQSLIYQELQNVSKTVGELKDALEGTPSAPGLKIRIDRLEQSEQTKRRHFGYLWSAVAALAGVAAKLLWHQ